MGLVLFKLKGNPVLQAYSKPHPTPFKPKKSYALIVEELLCVVQLGIPPPLRFGG